MKFSSGTQIVGLLCYVLPSVYAWGGLGHETVAFIASAFVRPATKNFFQIVLDNTSPQYLGNVATWADSFRYSKAGRFSEPFHYIDSKDDPPNSCSVSYSRDCGLKGCVVEAIKNYTSRVMDTSLSREEREMAAKFIVHFVGDIHQPLHDENYDKGGNGIKVTFDGKPTNLHAVWDTSMPEKLIGGYSLVDAQRWASALNQEIVSGSFKPHAASWLLGMDISDPESTTMIWAEEANKYVCSTVMPDGPDALDGKELNGDYYSTAIPIVQLQIARAGYRLAAWLDLIASSTTIEATEL